MRYILVSIFICISSVFLFYPEELISLSTGSPGGKTGSPGDGVSCLQCHQVNSSSSGIGSIATNIPSSGYVPGTVYTVTANINNAAALSINGFEITTEQDISNIKVGDFLITDPNTTQLTNNTNSVTHTPSGNNLTTWQFDWEAPVAGTGDVTFYGAFIEAGYPFGMNQGDFFTSDALTIGEYIVNNCIDSSLIDTTVACLTLFDPVCGCDSITYVNSCQAENWFGVTSWTLGACTPPSPCTVEINNGTVDIEICNGDTAVLEATIGFDTYLWTLASAGSPLGNSNIIEVSDPGIYIVIATDSTNCVDMDSIELIVYPETVLNPVTVPNPPVVCVGDSVVIEVNSGFLNYWWNTGNPLDQDEDRVVIFPTQDFVYVVEALDSNGCESRAEIEVFVDTCATSVHDFNANNIKIYPNPSNDICYIDINNSEVIDIEIVDIIGKVVFRKENISNIFSINTGDFLEGIYFIRIQKDLHIVSQKLIIDR